MSLENKYQQADAAERVLGANIRRTIAQFLRLHPELYCCEENERILFSAMEAADHLSPISLSSWEILYAENRAKLIDSPAARKQAPRRPTPVAPSGLTRETIESWSAKQLQHEMEASSARQKEIEAALARR